MREPGERRGGLIVLFSHTVNGPRFSHGLSISFEGIENACRLSEGPLAPQHLYWYRSSLSLSLSLSFSHSLSLSHSLTLSLSLCHDGYIRVPRTTSDESMFFAGEQRRNTRVACARNLFSFEKPLLFRQSLLLLKNRFLLRSPA